MNPGKNQGQLRGRIFEKYKKDGWEIKTIGDIATKIYTGSEVRRWQMVEGGYPAVEWRDIGNLLPLHFEKCVTSVDPKLIKVPKYFEHGDILISNMNMDLNEIGGNAVYFGREKCLAGDHVVVLGTDQNSKFISYVLSSKSSRLQMEEMSRKSTIYDLYPREIKQIKIPLPPLKIQNEIVEFLDVFVNMEEELKRDLGMKRDQYEYYKNLIFNRGIKELNWEIKSLGEIAKEIYSGEGVTKTQLNTGDHPAIRVGKICESSIAIEGCDEFVDPSKIKAKRYAEEGDLLVVCGGNFPGVLGRSCAYLGEEKCLVGNNIKVIKHGENPKYLSYFLSSKNAEDQLGELSRWGTLSLLHSEDIGKIKIPLPSPEEQAKAVEILDKLRSLIDEAEGDIPQMIRRNREQYNYYKELLLEK